MHEACRGAGRKTGQSGNQRLGSQSGRQRRRVLCGSLAGGKETEVWCIVVQHHTMQPAVLWAVGIVVQHHTMQPAVLWAGW